MKTFSGVWLTASVAILAAGGCGSPPQPHNLQGQVLSNGKPYKLAPSEALHITFVRDGTKTSYTAQEVNPDGTYTVIPADGKGVSAGNYHITVTSTRPGAESIDKFKGAYADEAKTPLTCEVPAGDPHPVLIDVGAGAVTLGP